MVINITKWHIVRCGASDAVCAQTDRDCVTVCACMVAMQVQLVQTVVTKQRTYIEWHSLTLSLHGLDINCKCAWRLLA
jgi:hypothetical protein